MSTGKVEKVEEEFDSAFHVYEPHRIGLPKLRPYVRELWRRRDFAAELSATNLRSAHSMTFFGQVWLILNPLMLAGVYYFLVSVISNRGGLDFLLHLVAGLFAFYFVSGCITTGAGSVIGGGRLLLNTAFPRLLMPLSAVRTAFFRFLPTLPVYFVIHLVARADWSWKMLLAVYFLATMVVFAAGAAAIFATLQVYFRDTSSFLPYFVRVWLYLSPVLYYAEDVSGKLRPFMVANPLYSMLGGWSDLLVRNQIPPLSMWVGATAWALAAAAVGSVFFMSRERDFAVRI